MAATRKQRVQRVVREIRQAYAGDEMLNEREFFVKYDEASYPILFWEAGPYEWAIDQSFKLNEKFRKQGIDIFVEPQFSFALAIFPGWG